MTSGQAVNIVPQNEKVKYTRILLVSNQLDAQFLL